MHGQIFGAPKRIEDDPGYRSSWDAEDAFQHGIEHANCLKAY
jgi:hypothetical protein